MFEARLVPSLLLFLSLIFSFTSCSKNDKKTAAIQSGHMSQIKLDDAVASEGCLSLPKLFHGINSLEPTMPLAEVPTAISFDSQYAIREGFREMIAYGQLQLAPVTVATIQDLPAASQDACSKLTLTSADGTAKDFTVKSSARDSLMAEADDGTRVEYYWLGPQRLESKRRYAALDQPCSSSDKPVLVTVTKVLDWSGAGIPSTVPATGSLFSIEPAFLSLAAEAVGDSVDSLTTDGDDGTKLLDLTKVAAMTAKPPRPEAISCSGSVDPTPDPAPTPDPTPDPNNPDDPTHPHDGDNH